MTNRRQFFAALCGLGVGSAVAATPITPDVLSTDATNVRVSINTTKTAVPLQIRSHNAVCDFQVDAQGRLWIRSNEGPYRRVVTE